MSNGEVIERLQKVSRYFKTMMKVGYDGETDIYTEHRESVKMAIALLIEQKRKIEILESERGHDWG